MFKKFHGVAQNFNVETFQCHKSLHDCALLEAQWCSLTFPPPLPVVVVCNAQSSGAAGGESYRMVCVIFWLLPPPSRGNLGSQAFS